MRPPEAPNDARGAAPIDRLAYAGLLPLLLLAALLWLVSAELRLWVAIALSAYAALIVSFLGGIHWGMGWSAMAIPGARYAPHRRHFLWGVAPSLLAWPGLLMPPDAGLAWLGLVLLVCYLVDRRLYPPAGLGHWLKLRFRLSTVAALCCFIGAAAL